MSRSNLGLLLFVLVLSACRKLPPDQAKFLHAQKAYQKGNYAVALFHLRPLVKDGHPAAQLLLGKMYAYGQGVPPDASKAEMLRNIAALRLASRGIFSGSKALGAALKDEAPDAAQQEEAIRSLAELNPEALENMANQMQSQMALALGNEPNVDLNSLVAKLSGELPKRGEGPSAPELKISGPVHRAEGMSLAILRKNAAKGDVLAIELLATAYAQGLYGLQKNMKEAAFWSQRAAKLRAQHPESSGDEQEQRPWGRMAAVVLVGLILMAYGLWLRVYVRQSDLPGVAG